MHSLRKILRFCGPCATALRIAVVLVPFSVNAATFYVAESGNDGDPGGFSTPFRTIQRAANVVTAGDSILVRDGIYGPEGAATGGDYSDVNFSPVVLRRSGSPGNGITIRSENRWGAILDCQMKCDSYINLANASNITIQDFVITHGYKEGIHSNDAAHHIVLRGNRFEYIANRNTFTPLGLDGLYTGANCHDFIIIGNVFHDIGRTSPNSLDHGIYLHGWNVTIMNNTFYNIPHGWSIQAADGLSNVIIANNTFAFGNGNGGDGQIMLWNRQSNLTIQNNIFYLPSRYAIIRYRSTVSNCAIDHNLVFGASLMADAGGCSVADTLPHEDPNFVNPSTIPFDFHLRAGSPAIGRGVDLSSALGNLQGMQLPPLSLDLGAFPYRPAPTLQLINATSGLDVFHAGDEAKAIVTGGLPFSQVTVTIGNWTGNLGYTDETGSFTFSGRTDASIIGTWSETWSIGGVIANPNPLTLTILP